MSERFESWAILEVMGHQRFAGKVTEATLAGGSFVRIDIPAVGEQPQFTKFFPPHTIYCLTPTTEEIARAMAKSLHVEPISPYDLPDGWKEAIRANRRLTVDEIEADDDY